MMALVKSLTPMPPRKTRYYDGDGNNDDWWYKDYRDPDDNGFNWIALLMLLILTLVAWISVFAFMTSTHDIKEMNDFFIHQHYPYPK
jgi:uncharacterized ion transporter superfamily protein YfcC